MYIKRSPGLFWNKVKKMNLYMFKSENKKLKINKKSEATIIIKEHQLLFSRLFTVGAVHQLDPKEVLSNELSTTPLFLFFIQQER